MTQVRAPRPVVPPRFFVTAALPFAIPALVTLALCLIGRDCDHFHCVISHLTRK